MSTAKNKKNATMTVPTFVAGSPDALAVTVAKFDQTENAQAALKVTDVAGNYVVCGPVLASVFPQGDTGKPMFATSPRRHTSSLSTRHTWAHEACRIGQRRAVQHRTHRAGTGDEHRSRRGDESG